MNTKSYVMTRWRFAIVVAVLIILAMGVSLLIGLQQSVWFDEAYTILIAKQPLAQLFHLVSIDTHPPLYYLLVKAWAHVFGWSELSLRSLSVGCMGAALLFATLLMRRLFGARAAIMTLLLAVSSPFILRYGFEIRMYGFAGMIGIAATYVLVVARQAVGRRQWLWYGVYALLLAMGVYTLYYVGFIWAAHIVWLAWAGRRQSGGGQRVAPWPWLIAIGVALALFAPWVHVLIGQVLAGSSYASVLQQLTMERLMGMLSFWFLYTPVYGLDQVSSLVMVAVIVVVAIVLARAVRVATREERHSMILFVCYVAVPLALIALFSLLRPFYLDRYVAPIVIGFVLLLGAAVAILIRANWRPARWLYLGLLVVSLIGVWQLMMTGNYNFDRLDEPVGRQTAAILAPVCHDRTIIFNQPYLLIDQSYYFQECPTYFLSETNPPLTGGYGMLHDSSRRVTVVGPHDHQTTVMYVHYSDDPAVAIAPGYRLIATQSIAKVMIDTYVPAGQ